MSCRLVLVVAAVAGITACSHAALPAGGISGPVTATSLSRDTSFGHAYVTDFGAGLSDGKLLQFDLRAGVAVAPPHVLFSTLHEPLGVAVGPDNLVYVAESAKPYNGIDAYRIRGTSAKLVRRMSFVPGLFSPEPEYLATDQLVL